MIVPLSASVITSSLCYLTQKGMSYLSTPVEPLEERVATVFERIRNTCANIKEMFAHLLGQRIWKLVSEVIFDNAWVSTFVVTLLLMITSSPMTFALFCETATIFLVVSFLSWLVRLGISNYLPDIGFFIACFLHPEFSTLTPRDLYVQLARRLMQEAVNGPVATDQRLDLITLMDIPEELRSDPLLSQHICPITRLPIRFPVRDTVGGCLYNSPAAFALADHPPQGLSQIQFNRDQLVRLQSLQGIIENRLRFHEEQLRRIAVAEFGNGIVV